MPSQIVSDCSKVLSQQKLTIAFAESASAGRFASEFSLTADSGTVLKGGVVSYDAGVKEQVLEISASFIEEFSPESAEVTKEMAFRLKDLIKSDIQVAVTGLTTAGGSEDVHKPVGTIFIHILVHDNSIALKETFKGSAEDIVLQALDFTARAILDEVVSLNQYS